MVALCLVGKGFGQSGKTIKPLYIDDPLPNISFGKMINYKDSTAYLSDFKGKLILFDFWFTHCSICLEAMPKLDSLQRLYGRHLQIIMVTKNTRQQVMPVITKWEQLHHAQWKIPMVVSDTTLYKYFRHRYEPHYAWLAPENRLVAQTSFFFITKEIVADYLKKLPAEIVKTGYSLDSLYKN